MSYYPPSTVIPVYSVYMGVAVFLTALRFWVRLYYSRTRLGFDDGLIVLGLAVAIACNGIQYYNSLEGTGGEAVRESDEAAYMQRVVASRKVDWAMIVIEKASFGAVKLSILFFYRRIFGVWDSFRKTNNVLIWIVAVWTVVFTLADVLIWGFDQTIALHRCGNRGALLLAFSVTSVVTDLPVLGLPFFYIGRLQMPRRKKLATSFVFLLGAVSTGASILRLIFLIVSYPVGRLNFAYTSPPDDQTPLVLKIFNPTFWALTELWLGVWAANLPPCAPLLRGLNVHVSLEYLLRRPSQVISSVYRRTWSRKSSSASQEQMLKKEKERERELELERQHERERGTGVAEEKSVDAESARVGYTHDDTVPTYGSVRYNFSRNHNRSGMSGSTNTTTVCAPDETLPSRDITPSLTPETETGSERGRRERGFSITSEEPPVIEPLQLTGTGRLSVFSHLPKSSESVNRARLR